MTSHLSILLLTAALLCFQLEALTTLNTPKKTVSKFFTVEMPASAKEIKEEAAQYLMSSMRKTPVVCPPNISKNPIMSSYAFIKNRKPEVKTARVASLFDIVNVFSDNEKPAQRNKKPPILLLHGFDSSALEFRRIAPLLAEERDVYAIDILGWGFIDQEGVQSFSPQAKMEHLRCFIRQVIGNQKCVAVGASLGGALAINLAAESPELVDRVVLIDAQGFIDGKGPADIPDFLANFGVGVLKSWPLRMYANILAYFDTRTFATWEAMMVGRLHCFNPTWQRASVDFLKSGGFVTSPLVPRVKQPTLVLWGANDKILEPDTVQKFKDTLPLNQVRVIDNCGHVPHLVWRLYFCALTYIQIISNYFFVLNLQEKASEAAYSILQFLGDGGS
jgi:pimeloyl-ACP methyl ester carboxylesterase